MLQSPQFGKRKKRNAFSLPLLAKFTEMASKNRWKKIIVGISIAIPHERDITKQNESAKPFANPSNSNSASIFVFFDSLVSSVRTKQKKDTKAMPQFIQCAASKQNITLKSKGLQRYSYVYIADAVAGILKILLDGATGEAYNIFF